MESYWFAHADGVSSLSDGTFSNYNMDDGLPFGGVNDITEDNEGSLWFSTLIGGAFRFNGSDFLNITTDDGIVSNSVRSIAEDAGNNKWLGTNEGISVLSSSNIHFADHDSLILLPEPHKINPVEDIKIDSQGRVWSGIYVDYLVTVGGVSVFNGWNWTGFNTDDGLVGPGVTEITIDSEDNVWVATTSGVSKISNIVLSHGFRNSDDLVVYPNPFSSKIIVKNLQIGEQLRNFDSCGSIVHSEVVKNSARLEVKLSEYSSGMYLIVHNGTCNRII